MAPSVAACQNSVSQPHRTTSKEIPSPPSPKPQRPPPFHQPEKQALRTPWLERQWGQRVADEMGTLYYEPGRLSGEQGFPATGSRPQRRSRAGTGQAQGPEAHRSSNKAAEPHGMGRGKGLLGGWLTPSTGEAEMGQEGKGEEGVRGLGAGAGGSRTALHERLRVVKARHNRKRGRPVGPWFLNPQIPWRKEQIHWSRVRRSQTAFGFKMCCLFFSPIIKMSHYQTANRKHKFRPGTQQREPSTPAGPGDELVVSCDGPGAAGPGLPRAEKGAAGQEHMVRRTGQSRERVHQPQDTGPPSSVPGGPRVRARRGPQRLPGEAERTQRSGEGSQKLD